MSRARRLLVVLPIGAAFAVAPSVAAEPTAGKSADTVITQLQKQGYDVQVNGRPAGDVSMLSTCTVTSIDHPAGPIAEAATATTVNVDVACPLIHG